MNGRHETEDHTRTYTILAPGVDFGQYRLIQSLGAGGMGEVYLADDCQLQRRVALKFLRPDYSADKNARLRFEREARAAASLDHRNVVTIFDVGDLDGRYYYAMQYVDGRSLRQLIDTETISFERALFILRQVCAGLEKAHAAGIVHRDLKPANIIVSEADQVTILDFGLARVLKDMQITEHGTAVGTANYMSPEQAQGIEVDQRADIFALGILFYELLVGINPFARGYAPATMFAITHDEPKPLKDVRSDLPESCQAIVDRALAKKVEDRYQSVDQLAADLERLSRGEVISAPQVATRSVGRHSQPSLAVLYLRNLGPVDDDYLSHGITEDLIIDLARIGSLRVAPMRRVLPLRDTNLSLEEIARQLDVGVILDGSIHRAGDRVKVTAQLVDVTNDETVWSNRWEERIENLPFIKQAFAEGILEALSVSSSVRAAAGVGKAEAVDPAAYEYYLRGKYLFEKMQQRSDVDTALGLFERALELEPSLLAARIGRASILSYRADVKAAVAELERVLQLARNRGSRADQVTALIELGRNLGYIPEYDRARACLQEAMTISRDIGNLEGGIAARSRLLALYKMAGHYDDAEQVFADSMKLCSKLGDLSKSTDALHFMGWIYLNSGSADKARKLFGSALSLARESRDRHREASLLNAIAATYFGRIGKHFLKTELSYYQRAMSLWEELGDSRNISGAASNFGLVQRRLGQFEKALVSFTKAVRETEEMGDHSYSAMFHANRAETLLSLGRLEEALTVATEADRVAVACGSSAYRAQPLAIKGLALYQLGRLSEATALVESAVEIAARGHFVWQEAHALSHLGTIQYLSGAYDTAAETFRRARDVATPARFEELAFISELHLAAISYPQGHDARYLDLLRDGVRRLTETHLEIPARRLLGEAMVRGASDVKERAEGIEVLVDAKKRAGQLPYPLEKRLIEKLLASLG